MEIHLDHFTLKEALVIHPTWHMTNGFNRIGSCVDDSEHSRDDAKEDPGNDTADGGNVELIHHQGPLVVHDSI